MSKTEQNAGTDGTVLRYDTANLELDIAMKHAGAARWNEQAAASGEPYENAFDAIIRALREAITETEQVRDHTCKYNDEDMCDVCGADGRS